MNAEEKRYVASCINNEGFHYCFDSYSYFEEITDKKFHELREKYLEAARNLENYVNQDVI